MSAILVDLSINLLAAEAVPPRAVNPLSSDQSGSFGDHLQRAHTPTDTVKPPKTPSNQTNTDNSGPSDQYSPSTIDSTSESESSEQPESSESDDGQVDANDGATSKDDEPADKDSLQFQLLIEPSAANAAVVVKAPPESADQSLLTDAVTQEAFDESAANRANAQELVQQLPALPSTSPLVAIDLQAELEQHSNSNLLENLKAETQLGQPNGGALAVAENSITTADLVPVLSFDQEQTVVEAVGEEKSTNAGTGFSQRTKPSKSIGAHGSQTDGTDNNPIDTLKSAEISDESAKVDTSETSSRPTATGPNRNAKPRATASTEPPMVNATSSIVESTTLVGPNANGPLSVISTDDVGNREKSDEANVTNAGTDSTSQVQHTGRSQSSSLSSTTSTGGREANTSPLSSIGSKSGSKPTQPAGNVGEVDRARFVNRVARAVHTAAERGGEIRLRLSPPELGSLKLEVIVRDGVMNAHVETETAAARSVLIDNLAALRERLAEQNIKIDHFDVDVRDGSTGSLPDRTADQANDETQRQANQREKHRRSDRSQTPTQVQPSAPRVIGQGQLNVIV